MRHLSFWVAIAAAVFLVAAPPASTSAAARQIVSFRDRDVSPGTIVIKTHQRRLYLVLGDGRAMAYPVGVGRAGMRWSGRTHIDGKYVRPAWRAPPSIQRNAPVIPGGSPRNPMGAAAMTLSGTEYAIHGTNVPSSVGRFVSHGCIRMYNRDIVDLFQRVSVGTLVIVTR